MHEAALLGGRELARGKAQHLREAAAGVADLVHQLAPPFSTRRCSAARTGSRGSGTAAGRASSGGGRSKGGSLRAGKEAAVVCGGSRCAAVAAARTDASASSDSRATRSPSPSE